MQLPGRLATTTLGDVLGALYREGATGCLELEQSGGVRHRIHVKAGLVQQVETPCAVLRLGELLRRRANLSEIAVREIERCSLAEFTRPLGQALLERCVVSRDELAAALRVQNRYRLERLYALRDARIIFRVLGVSRPNEPVGLSASEVLKDRPRARDRRRKPSASQCASVSLAGRAEALSTLGLGEEADSSQIKEAFRRLAANVHPDRHSAKTYRERARVARQFARISAAYHSLVA